MLLLLLACGKGSLTLGDGKPEGDADTDVDADTDADTDTDTDTDTDVAMRVYTGRIAGAITISGDDGDQTESCQGPFEAFVAGDGALTGTATCQARPFAIDGTLSGGVSAAGAIVGTWSYTFEEQGGTAVLEGDVTDTMFTAEFGDQGAGWAMAGDLDGSLE